MYGCGALSGGTVRPRDDAPLTPNYLADITPATWALSDLRYRIEGGASNIPGVDIPRTTRRGVGRWEHTLRGLLSFGPAKAGEAAPAVVEYVTADQLPPGVIGVTSLAVTPDGRIEAARVRILRSLTPVRMEATAGHEAGHLFGVWGGFGGGNAHSPHEGDLMYPDVPGRAFVRLRDYNTLRAMYRAAREADPAASRDAGPVRWVEVCRLRGEAS